jgi:hypothetical protein
MTLPEQALLRNRRQILDDETGAAHRFNGGARQDVPHQEPIHEDNWVSSFVDRLAGLIRNIGQSGK